MRSSGRRRPRAHRRDGRRPVCLERRRATRLRDAAHL